MDRVGSSWQRGRGGRVQGRGGGRGGHSHSIGGRQDRGGHHRGGDHGESGDGGRGDRRSYQRVGGGDRARGGFFRGRGSRRGGGSVPIYLRTPDPYPIGPYKETYTPEQQNLPSHQVGWKALPEKQEDVEIQKYTGSIGKWALKKIDVSVNHFLIEPSMKTENYSFPIPTLYHYDIGYDIDKRRTDGGASGGEAVKLEEGDKKTGAKTASRNLPKHLIKAILDYLIPKIRKDSGHQAIAVDERFNLYSTKLLKEVGIEAQHYVTFEELRKANLFQDDDNATVQVTIQPTIDKATGKIHTIDTQEIARYVETHGSLKGFQFTAEMKQSFEAAYNTFVKSMPNFRYFSVGRSTMVPCEEKQKVALGGGLEAWKGISANIAMGWKPYLNVDIANCAFMVDSKVLDVLYEKLENKCTLVSTWNYNDLDESRSLLRTCKIWYKMDDNKRTGPIRDVPLASANTLKFRWVDKHKGINKDVSVFQYYKERYGHTLKYPDGPVLEVRKGRYVPAELCVIKSGQSYNRKLDGYQTTNMLNFAKRSPRETVEDIGKRMKAMNLKENQVLGGLGVRVADQMLKMKVRVLVPPTLRYGAKKESPQDIAHINPENGQWNIRDSFHFYKPASVKKWGVLVFGCTSVEQREVQDFANELMKNGEAKGMQFQGKANPIIVDKKDRSCFGPEENAKDLEKYFKDDFKGCDLCVVVFPKKGSPVYGHIKYAAEVECGMLTQCVAEKNVIQLKDSIMENMVPEINSKLGGINYVTGEPLLEPEKANQFYNLLSECPVMILGADVTHPPPGSKKTVNGEEFIMPSYAAVTGSLDKTCMPYMTEMRAQRKAGAGAAEVIQDLEEIVEKMLKCFETSSKGMYPKKIIYFRDGVGEGQFPEVLHIEMNAIRRACMKIEKDYQPKITFITVQKRHKTRIFWHSGPGRIENAPAGTVVDKEIVHSCETDFILLSHHGMMGTSRPSRYHVLWDDSDFSQDELQSLAYTLCYMYVRCTKSVKMPAATYYAHLAADRAKRLCEGFETKYGEPTTENLNKLLERKNMSKYPMHFV